MRLRYRRIRKPQVFAILMIASAVFVFTPREYLAPIRNLTHVLTAYPQRASLVATRAVTRQAGQISERPVPADIYEKTQLEKKSLETQLITCSQRIAKLEATVDSLTYIRNRL